MEQAVAVVIFMAGQEAFEAGISREDNPYDDSSTEARGVWDQGWLEAEKEGVAQQNSPRSRFTIVPRE